MSSRSSLRRRLVWTLIGVVALTVVVLGGASAVLLDRSLRARLVENAVTAAEFNLAVLATAVGLPTAPDPEMLEESRLLDRFVLRGAEGAVAQYADGISVTAGTPPPAPSPELQAIVDAGEIGYEFVDTLDGPKLITGARLPADGPDFFFSTSVGGLVAANQQMLAVMAGAGSGAILAGSLLAAGLARRMLRPVEAARRAAETMSAGDLEVRLAVEGSDEFARLSAAFNDMAASLQETVAELEAARLRERRFIADASHELRTPLTGLANAARLLAERTARAADHDQRHLASLVESEVARLGRLVDDLLEMSRLDSGASPPRMEPVDISALLGALIDLHHPKASLDCRVTAPVVTDRHALERIVGNLLDNARRHAAGAPAVVTVGIDGENLALDVSDRGPGVPDDQIGTIFQRFTTGDNSRTGGTGLGLAIVARHVASLGGTVLARSPESGGLTVTVRLPVGELLHHGDGAGTPPAETGDQSSTGEST